MEHETEWRNTKTMNNHGTIAGETCGRNECVGVIIERDHEGCSCHINPPCSNCVEDRHFCFECGWKGLEDQQEAMRVASSKVKYEPYKKRTVQDLDKTKIDWISSGHTSFSMKKIGVFPKGSTIESVRKKVKGTFGGRFQQFDELNCTFIFIAYTD